MPTFKVSLRIKQSTISIITRKCHDS